MKNLNKLKSNHEKYLKYGLLFYLSSIQYFIVQIIVASKFSPTYSLTHNVISDLGNTACAPFNGNYLCSPDHLLMNISFVVLGLTTISGSYCFIKASASKRRAILLGFDMLAIGGIGTILVGLFPENAVLKFHSFGASLPFLVGNLGMIIVGIAWMRVTALRAYTILSGVVALAALSLFVVGQYAGLGIGGMERLVAYPQTIWMIVISTIYLVQPDLLPPKLKQ